MGVCALAACLCLFMALGCALRGAGGGTPDSTGVIVYLTLSLCCLAGGLHFLISRRPSATPSQRERAEAAMASAMAAAVFLGVGYMCAFYFWSWEFVSAPSWLRTLPDPARRGGLAISMGALLFAWLQINRAARGVSESLVSKPHRRLAALLAECFLIPGVFILALIFL